MKSNIFVLALFLSGLTGTAQGPGSENPPVEKTAYRYVGIQANLLLQQFISFNSNSSINSNPYLFAYSKSNVATGKGIAFGTGLSVNQNSTNDGVSVMHVETVNFAFRLGSERKFFQQEKFVPFYGFDFAIGAIYNKTSSQLIQTFPTTTVDIESIKVFIGSSFRGGLLYALSKHVFLGTEFYFNLQLSFTNNTRIMNNNDLPVNVGFQVPTALYLVYRY